LWVVSSRYLDGGGDLRLVSEVVCVIQGAQNVLQLPGLVAEVFRTSGIELSNGGEEIG
jgi:hypothetical protein